MDRAAWSSIVARYQRPSTKRALWQLASTLIPYFLLWYVIYHAVEVSLWLAIWVLESGIFAAYVAFRRLRFNQRCASSREAKRWVG